MVLGGGFVGDDLVQLSQRPFRLGLKRPSQPVAEWRKRFSPDGMEDNVVCPSD
jgi:hypothetical protein